MIPFSISPTALETAEDCLSKFWAHNIMKGDGFQNKAATLGTTLHSALEMFVKQDGMIWDLNMLTMMFRMHFMKNFPVIDIDADAFYQDGKAILEKWFNRSYQFPDLKSVVILEKEVRRSIEIPYKLGGEKMVMPFNFVIDRLDKVDDTTYRVVDYKSQRSPLSLEEMRKKLQVRAYSLATRIRFPFLNAIQVQLDFLRYSSVTVTLTREDDERTWKYIKALLQKIIDTPDESIPETLGGGCQYCIRRALCKKMRSNMNAQGILGMSLDELVGLRYELLGKQSGISNIIDEIDSSILSFAKEEDIDEFPSGLYDVRIKRSKRRYVDEEKLSAIVPPDVRADYAHINVGELDLLKADPRLDDGQRSMLSTAVSTKTGEERVLISKRKEELE